jgi:Ca2+-binding RTX toxin-like protein
MTSFSRFGVPLFNRRRGWQSCHQRGRAGNDALEGGIDDDVLTGDAGAEALDGGNGSDTASYTDSGVAVTAGLDAGTGLR